MSKATIEYSILPNGIHKCVMRLGGRLVRGLGINKIRAYLSACRAAIRAGWVNSVIPDGPPDE